MIATDHKEITDRLDKIDRSVRSLQLHLGRYLELEVEFKLLLNKHHDLETKFDNMMRFETLAKKVKN